MGNRRMTTRIERGFRPWIAAAVVVAVNAAAWLALSNPAYLVAQQRDVLLGRYSVGRLTTLGTMALLSTPVLTLIWTPKAARRKRLRQLTALTTSLLATLVLFDLVLRLVTPRAYIAEGAFHHRRPNQTFTGVTVDAPVSAFSYPLRPAGHPDVPYTLTTDGRGFRNARTLDRCDVLVIGDSFTEGSECSDEQVWPALLAKRLARPVYNLGMAGGHPQSYLTALEEIGLALEPKLAIVMIYEGNDFRGPRSKQNPGFGQRLRAYRKQSPLIQMLRRAMVRGLGAVGAEPVTRVERDDPLWPVAWLPAAVPDGGPHRYAFDWKQLRRHLVTDEAFRPSPGCRTAVESLAAMKRLCVERGIRLAVIYAPDKPHVLWPLLRDTLDAEQVRAFLGLHMDDPPPADICLDALAAGCEVREAAIESFCRDEAIAFVSATAALREALAAGRPVYFTYDQHWTPAGNRVVADLVAAVAGDLLTAGAAPSGRAPSPSPPPAAPARPSTAGTARR